MIASRALLTQPGHIDSVCRGHPSVGVFFSHDFSSGLSDHFGVKFGFGMCLLKNWMLSKATPAVLLTAKSISFHARELAPAFLGISKSPHFHSENRLPHSDKGK